ncbi:DUF2065 domain-containing protein [Fretibacter rubidus]|uniref:DUF2065 domain-containing protein n=1 Tax=Fretibacter rubidus TaxID=570162 RepID=UPI00352B4281
MGWGTVLLIAIGGALAVEGAAWAIFPRGMRDVYAEMMSMPDVMLHRAGLISVALGSVMIFGAVKMIGS